MGAFREQQSKVNGGFQTNRNILKTALQGKLQLTSSKSENAFYPHTPSLISICEKGHFPGDYEEIMDLNLIENKEYLPL